jgi:hypothetical protein
MVSLSSLLLGGRWRMSWCVALGLGAINSPNGDWVKGGLPGPWNGLVRPAWAHSGPVSRLLRPVLVPESSRSFPLLHVGPCRQFLSELDVAPCPARFGTFLTGSSEFVIFLGLVARLLGVMVTSLHDIYRSSRSCHEVLDELIPEVLLSTLKACINTKLQNRHTRTNLLYQGG